MFKKIIWLSSLVFIILAGFFVVQAAPNFIVNTSFPGGIWNTAGNVGIGTTNPGAKLDVVTGGATLFSKFTGASTDILATGNDAIGLYQEWNASTAAKSIIRLQTRSAGAGNYVQLFLDAGNQNIRFNTNSTERVRIDSAGNVGIGTTNPTEKLDFAVIGGSSDTNNIRLGVNNGPASNDGAGLGGGLIWKSAYGSGYTKRSAGILQTAEGNYFKSGLAFFTNGTSDATTDWVERMRITMGGNVGIGTTAPGTKLDVTGTLRNTLATTHSLLGGVGTAVVMADNTGTLYNTALSTFISSNTLWSGTRNGNIWNGDAGVGNVGIGTTAPSQKMHVVGNIKTSGDIITDGNYGLGLVGLYSATRYQNVFAMGTSYRLAADGTTPGNLYGIAWTHSNISGQSKSGLAHQALFMNNGVTQTAIGTGIWTLGGYTQNGTSVNSFSGNVGIGTVSPGTKLSITGAYPQIQIGSVEDEGLFFAGASAALHYNWLIGEQYNVSSALEITPSTVVGGTTFSTPTAVFTQTGNVGIGTTIPVSRLNISEATGTVYGAVQGSVVIDHENSGGASSIVFRSRVNRGSDYGFIQYQDTATVGGAGETAKLIIGTSNDTNDDIALMPTGNVGIGTTNPTAKLDFGTSGAASNVIRTYTSGNIIQGIGNDGYGMRIFYPSSSAGNLAIGTVSTADGVTWSEKVRINNLGNVGIGTTNPLEKLYVQGASNATDIEWAAALKNPNNTISGSYGVGLKLRNGDVSEPGKWSGIAAVAESGWSNLTGLALYANATEKVRIMNNGNVGIGTTNPGVSLEIAKGVRETSLSGNSVLDIVGTAIASRTTNTVQNLLRLHQPNTALSDSKGSTFAIGISFPDDPGNNYPRTRVDFKTTGRTTDDADAGNTVMSLMDSGNVGIGTTAPGTGVTMTGGLDVNGTGSTQFIVRKNGGFGLALNVNANYSWTMYDGYGSSWKAGITQQNGNVGIGLTNPASKLEVLGTLTVSTVAGDGLGMIKAGTFDPPYTIDGVKYATYLPSMTGVKEETTGTTKLVGIGKSGLYKKRLEMLEATPGSDLWLFSRVTDIKNKGLDDLTVLLSPHFEGTTWYEKDEARGAITIYARPKGQNIIPEVSYRLTAPRFDNGEFKNQRSVYDPVEGFNLDKLIK